MFVKDGCPRWQQSQNIAFSVCYTQDERQPLANTFKPTPLSHL